MFLKWCFLMVLIYGFTYLLISMLFWICKFVV